MNAVKNGSRICVYLILLAPVCAAQPHPDLSGVWASAGYGENIAKDMKNGDVPMTRWAQQLYRQRQEARGKGDPDARCLPEGVPRSNSRPFKIVQTPDFIAILYEGNVRSFRQIYLDGRSHPDHADKTWWGHSIGHWEGNTLVVDTVGFNDRTWLDAAGHPHSDQLHVIERYTRPDSNHLSVQVAIEDPIAYTHPWTVTEVSSALPGTELHEYICNDKSAVLRK